MKKTAFLMSTLILCFVITSSCSDTPGSPGPRRTATPTSTATVTPIPEYVVSYQQGVSPTAYAGSIDNCLISNQPTSNYGTLGELSIGRSGGVVYRVLMKFDISTGVPGTAVITRAELAINTNMYDLNNTINAYAVTAAWEELTSSWNKWNAAGSWTTPGGDMGALISGIFHNTAGTWVFPIDASVINGWLATPSTNNGFLLMSGDESVALWTNMFSNNFPTATARPVLKIYYTLP